MSMTYEEICKVIEEKPFLLERMYSGKGPIDLFLQYRGNKNDGIDMDVSIYNVVVYVSCYEYLRLRIGSDSGIKNYKGYQYEIEKVRGLSDMVIRGDTAVNCMSLIMQIVNYGKNRQDIIDRKNTKEIRKRLDSSDIVKDKRISELLEEHICLCYGLGNFYPIPFLKSPDENNSLNQAKGYLRRKGYNGVQFRDDMSAFLNVVHGYFVNGISDSNVSVVKRMHHKYKNWADFFGSGKKGWENFVKENYFEAFVDEEYIPHQFWQVTSNGIIEDAKNYLKEINDALRVREDKIFEEFKKKNHDAVKKMIEDLC